jgi:hypothetical protein
LSLVISAASAALLTLLFGGPLPAEQFQIYLNTSPRAEQLHPWKEPAALSLLVTAADGRPVQQGWLAVTLEAPLPGIFFSTDYPIVEGSRLADLRLPLRRGRADWRYVFPIRGEYRMTVDYVTAEGKKASKIFQIRIPETRLKWATLGGFLVILFLVGFTAGRIFSGARLGSGKTAACLIIGVVSLLPLSPCAAGQRSVEAKHAARLEIAPARVGQPALVQWRLLGDGGGEKSTSVLTLIITHLEKQQIVFAVEKIFVADEFSINFQFSDGAEYKISAVADIGKESVRTEQIIQVAAVEPPARTIVPALALFLIVIAAGTVAGRWSRRKAVPRGHS